MALAGRRRRRQPRWIVLALILSLVVVAVNAAVSNRSPEPTRRLERLAYLDSVRPQVQRSNEQAGDLVSLRDKATELGRAGIARSVERMEREAADIVDEVAAVEAPSSMADPAALLQATLVARARSVASIGEALKDALGTDPADNAVGQLAQAGADLVTADRTYELFLRLLPKGDDTEAAMPDSQWVTDAGMWDGPAVAAFVATLRSSEKLTPVHDVSVVLMHTDPSPLATEGDAAVMAAGRSVGVSIVVANVGNEAETDVPIAAVLTGADGASDSKRILVDLAPGQRRTVTFKGLQPPLAQPVTLSASAGPVAGETDVESNTLTRTLLFR